MCLFFQPEKSMFQIAGLLATQHRHNEFCSLATDAILLEHYLTAEMKWGHQTVATLPCHHFLRANGKSRILPQKKTHDNTHCDCVLKTSSSINGQNWDTFQFFKSLPCNPWPILFPLIKSSIYRDVPWLYQKTRWQKIHCRDSSKGAQSLLLKQ